MDGWLVQMLPVRLDTANSSQHKPKYEIRVEQKRRSVTSRYMSGSDPSKPAQRAINVELGDADQFMQGDVGGSEVRPARQDAELSAPPT